MRVTEAQKRLIEPGLRNELRRRALISPARVYVVNAEDDKGKLVIVAFGSVHKPVQLTIPSIKRGVPPLKIVAPIWYELRGKVDYPSLQDYCDVLDQLEQYINEQRDKWASQQLKK